MNIVRLTLSVLLVAVAPVAAGAEEQPGFRFDGEIFQGKALPPALRQNLFELEASINEQREQLLTGFAIERYLAERAAAEGKTVEELQTELLVPTPPDEETLRSFYEENREQIPVSFEEARDQLVKYLQQQQIQERLTQLVDTMREEKGFELILPELDPPVFDVATEGYPSKGATSPEVTVVEFADFQCPYCKMATDAVENVLEEYGDRVRVVYRDFPINPSGVSEKIALGGVCAAEQDRFWDYHDLAFERQGSLDEESPQTIAAEIGLDEEAFAACISSEETQVRVEESKAEALELGVSGTPAFFVNGRQLQVGQNLERDLAAAVEKALSGSR